MNELTQPNVNHPDNQPRRTGIGNEEQLTQPCPKPNDGITPPPSETPKPPKKG